MSSDDNCHGYFPTTLISMPTNYYLSLLEFIIPSFHLGFLVTIFMLNLQISIQNGPDYSIILFYYDYAYFNLYHFYVCVYHHAHDDVEEYYENFNLGDITLLHNC